MDKLVVLVTTIWSWLWIIQTAVGDYDVSVRLLEYTRDEDCGCDGLSFLGCHECDVYFQICLQPLSPTQGQICQGNNQDYRPMFQIAVHAFDYSSIGGNDNLGVTSYTYRGNRPTVQTVTTTPGNKNMRYAITTVELILIKTYDECHIFICSKWTHHDTEINYHLHSNNHTDNNHYLRNNINNTIYTIDNSHLRKKNQHTYKSHHTVYNNHIQKNN
uniref:Uncharacterized protein n=1 Tax=Magallana gigas TaxID=29159 RepID=K1QA96_MAGGI